MKNVHIIDLKHINNSTQTHTHTFLPAERGSCLGVKQVVSRGQLKGLGRTQGDNSNAILPTVEQLFRYRLSHHAGGAPDVGWRVVVRTNQNLNGAILTGLNVFAEVLVLKTEKNQKYDPAICSQAHLVGRTELDWAFLNQAGAQNQDGKVCLFFC